MGQYGGVVNRWIRRKKCTSEGRRTRVIVLVERGSEDRIRVEVIRHIQRKKLNEHKIF